MKKKPNSKYYRNKADELFMAQFRGMPCEICGTTHNTCGHHLIGKSRSKALRYDKRNIVVLCQEHHTYGTKIAPHSLNYIAVENFVKWFSETKKEQHQWITENAGINRRYTYMDAVENMKAGREAWNEKDSK